MRRPDALASYHRWNDLDARTLECMRLKAGQYVIDQTASGTEIFRPKSMKGVRIPLLQLSPPATRRS